MKRIIVVLMILSMATTVNAALTLTISWPSHLEPGESMTFTVGYSGAAILAADVDIVCTVGAGVISNGVILTTNRDTALDIVGINPVSGNYEMAIMNDILGTDLGSPLFSFQWTAPSNYGAMTISLIENSFIGLDWELITGAVMPTLNVTTIPEPMTMGLLGLGGLFLRRRSK